MASALFALSSDGGSTYGTAGVALADATALAYDAAGSYSIKARLDSTAGVNAVLWTITSADDAHNGSLPTVTTNPDRTCSFSVPKQGGAWLLQCKVNGGVDPATNSTATLTRALAVKVLNANGLQEIAVGESTEAGPNGWTKAVNDGQRAAGGAPSGSAGGDLSGTYPNPTVSRITGVPADLSSAAAARLLVIKDVSSVMTVRLTTAPAAPRGFLAYNSGITDLPYFALELADTIDIGAYKGHRDGGFRLTTGSIDVAGSGSISPTNADMQAGVIRLTGALSGDRTVALPSGTARCNLFQNNTTGTFTLRIQGDGGGFCYLAPGQVKRLFTDQTTNGSLVGEGLRVIEFTQRFTISGDTVGNNDRTLFKLPAGCAITVCEIFVDAAPVSGTATLSVGMSGSYNELLLATAATTAGQLIGADSAESGADFTGKTSAYSSATETLVMRNTVGTATLTAGAVRVHVVAVYKGE
jgi:hypothetical protein